MRASQAFGWLAVSLLTVGFVWWGGIRIEPGAILDEPEPSNIVYRFTDDDTDQRFADLEMARHLAETETRGLRETIESQAAEIEALKIAIAGVTTRLQRATSIPRRKPVPDPPAASYLSLK